MIVSHPDVFVEIQTVEYGKYDLHLFPNRTDAFIPIDHYVTSYPLDLIRLILKTKGAYLIDEIRREEDPSYVMADLKANLFLYEQRANFTGKRLLDFGCGSGASTIVLSRLLPQTEVVGVEMMPAFLEIARARAEHYKTDVRFFQSPDQYLLPPGIGRFDYVMLSAVYEHLLPDERQRILQQLWSVMQPGALLFINQTPNKDAPIETHTTRLPLLNYLPDRLAFRYARRWCPKFTQADTWSGMLRRGIRGTTVAELLSLLPANAAAVAIPGVRDGVDLWYHLTPNKSDRTKLLLWLVYKSILLLTRKAVVPQMLNVAIRKEYQ